MSLLRIRFDDLLAYQRKDDEERRRVADELTADAQELGMGDQVVLRNPRSSDWRPRRYAKPRSTRICQILCPAAGGKPSAIVAERVRPFNPGRSPPSQAAAELVPRGG